ncbi:MAG: hypothetical protein LUD18_10425 [Lachnospiraceae bacterium]|nr:hypothetical protein [Lachnospiraceae bacterium]
MPVRQAPENSEAQAWVLFKLGYNTTTGTVYHKARRGYKRKILQANDKKLLPKICHIFLSFVTFQHGLRFYVLSIARVQGRMAAVSVGTAR